MDSGLLAGQVGQQFKLMSRRAAADVFSFVRFHSGRRHRDVDLEGQRPQRDLGNTGLSQWSFRRRDQQFRVHFLLHFLGSRDVWVFLHASWRVLCGMTGSVTVAAAAPTPSPSATPDPGIPAQALNISTRLEVQTGDQVLIGGFIITGTAPKRVVLRAIGPSLAGAGMR